MLWLFRAVTLVFNGVLLQFIQLLGFIGLATALTAGALRGPWWTFPIIAVAFGLIAKYLPSLHLSWLAKASSSSERLFFLFAVYLVISAVGYFIGRYGREIWARGRRKPRGV